MYTICKWRLLADFFTLDGKNVHVVSQQLLPQLTDIHEISCEHNACAARPKGV